jgi:kumamolisin
MPSGRPTSILAASARAPMDGTRRTGPTDPSEPVVVTLFLRRGSPPAAAPSLAELGSRHPRERRYLTRTEFAATYGASSEDLAAIRAFASDRGLRVVLEHPARRSVQLAGTAAEVSAAFGVELAHYEYPGGSYRGRVGAVRLPAELVGIVEGVFGLDNRPQARPHFRRRADAAPTGASYTPLAVAQAYAYPPGLDGTGQSIALIELGGGYSATDLATYFRSLRVGSPTVTAVGVDGGSNAPTGNPDGPDGEVELDLEVAGALAPGAALTAYFAPNTDQGFLDAVTTALHDPTTKPAIVSISWGGPEPSWTSQARSAFASVFEDAATLGITVLVAAGDNGATDGVSNGALTVDFPASAPGVISCGGTRLTLDGSSVVSEIVWNELAGGEGATGGGVSEAFPLPAYQANRGVPAAPSGFVGRGVPDVAGDADPTTGYEVLIDGSSTVIGGTSAVAPLWAALVARINQSLGTSLGYANAQLYGAEPAFRDITSGNNGGYSAGPGWDACTGLGSPNGAALLAALSPP